MPEPLRILLINAINANVEVEGRYPGLGLAYLVSSAKKQLPNIDIQFRIADREIRKVTQEFRPSFVGISAVSQNFNIAKKYGTITHKKAKLISGSDRQFGCRH